MGDINFANTINWNKTYSPRVRVFMHIGLWLIMSYVYYCTYSRLDPNPCITAILAFKDIATVIITFYTLSYIIIPRFLFRGRLALTFLFGCLSYTCWLVLTYFACVYITHHFTVAVRMGRYMQVVLSGGSFKTFGIAALTSFILDFVFLIMPPVSIKLIKAVFIQSNRSLLLERDKLDLEVSFLKAQINPHFLFNTLNNIYSMVITKDERAGPMVLHLSDLMRYTLYESDDQTISLSREISFIEDYLELERIRYGNNVSISLKVEGTISDQQIAPLIMFPFIENAFKHGLDNSVQQSWVDIRLTIDNRKLHFEVTNSTGRQLKTNTFGGVGINNVKKRLNIYYKGRYDLQIKNADQTYSVILDTDL